MVGSFLNYEFEVERRQHIGEGLELHPAFTIFEGGDRRLPQMGFLAQLRLVRDFSLRCRPIVAPSWAGLRMILLLIASLF